MPLDTARAHTAAASLIMSEGTTHQRDQAENTSHPHVSTVTRQMGSEDARDQVRHIAARDARSRPRLRRLLRSEQPDRATGCSSCSTAVITGCTLATELTDPSNEAHNVE